MGLTNVDWTPLIRPDGPLAYPRLAWYAIARAREAKGDNEGAARARRQARLQCPPSLRNSVRYKP